MGWLRGDPVAEIDGLLDRHREDLHAWQHQLEDALVTERQALDAAEAARAVQMRCLGAIDADRDEIDRLLEERARLIPTQREPSP